MGDFLVLEGKDGKRVEVDPDSIIGFIDHEANGCEILLPGHRIQVKEDLESVKNRWNECYGDEDEEDFGEEEFEEVE